MMNDDIGLHKVGNGLKDSGSISLHLYTPPFASCKVWDDPSKPNAFEFGKIGYFSTFGLPSPALEGKKGNRAKLLQEIIAYVPNKNCRKRIRPESGLDEVV
jgi:hypothetical protein